MQLPVIEDYDYTAMGGRHTWDRACGSYEAACQAVADAIFPNQPDPDDPEEAEALKRAIVAAIDVDMAYGQSGGIGEDAASVRVGSFSMTSGAGGSSYDSDMAKAIRRALLGTSLLYAGVC